MILKEIVDFESCEFRQSIEIYRNSFPPNETRPFKKIIEMLESDTNYYLIAAVDDNNNNSIMGISLMYVFRALNAGLLDYLAITPTYRRQGHGKELFNYTFEKFCTVLPKGIGLFIEVQKEDDSTEPQEMLVRKNRLRFYGDLGARLLYKVRYMLPPVYPGIDMEEMHLMIKPLGRLSYLSKETVISVISNIYSTIYQYYSNDLINRLSEDSPEKVMFHPI
jgi:GNAT superfamily N-acetyltransferase